MALVWGPVGWAQAPVAPAAAHRGEVHARGDIAGDWQGTLEIPNRFAAGCAASDRRAIRVGVGRYSSSPTREGSRSNVTGLTLDGPAVKFSVDQMGASYARDGELGRQFDGGDS